MGITGSSRVDGTPTQTATGAKDCGEYADTFQPAVSDASKAALDCFYQAYQQCTPAMLTSLQLFNSVIRTDLSLQGVPGGCSVAIEVTGLQRNPSPGQERKSFHEQGNCTQLSRSDSGGLLFSGCTGISSYGLGN
jgi:hypothetical protein